MGKNGEAIIPVSVTGSDMVDLDLLEEFQGNFKVLPASEALKLKGQLKTLGICEPFVCWKDGDRVRVIDGHQRMRVLREMIADKEASLGVALSIKNAVPVVFVQPADKDEAIRMVLSLASTYGRLNTKGLGNFCQSFGISEEELQGSFSFPELDVAGGEEGAGGEDAEQVDFTAKKKKMVECPECGKVFDAKKHKHDPKAAKEKDAVKATKEKKKK